MGERFRICAYVCGGKRCMRAGERWLERGGVMGRNAAQPSDRILPMRASCACTHSRKGKIRRMHGPDSIHAQAALMHQAASPPTCGCMGRLPMRSRNFCLPHAHGEEC